ncbi:hypothetical protein [Halospeciosus flavus]|uniref:Uncharacterized protein n=2 Tax=Halospeciosus flavus TaxID=3032283 RepID=A0ABD5Z3H7_9EURY|nr:hypothetical protein [Halospeciosus flavus]
MRLLGSRLADLDLIEMVQYFPSGKEDRVVVSFEASYFPNVVDTANLEFRLRLNGDFNFQYREDWSGESWTCRWDRHPNSHNRREHFHIPPRPQEENAIDADFPDNPNEILKLILETIENRINDLWTATTNPEFPAEYEFEGEYGDDWLC